jgi:hypothetical protein
MTLVWEGHKVPTAKKKKPVSAGSRTPKGKKQMLSILDEKVIEAVKIATARKRLRMSTIVEDAIK